MAEVFAGKRGLVIGISTIFLTVVLLWFAIFYSSEVRQRESDIYADFAVYKAKYVYDDVLSDLNRLLGASVLVKRDVNYTSIWIRDVIPPDISRESIKDWNSYIQDTYAPRQNSDMNLSIDNLADGKTELLFSNGLQYDYNHAPDANRIHFFKTDGGNTGVLTYDINLHVVGARYDEAGSVPWVCDSGGDVNVNLSYTDSYNEGFTSICRQDSTSLYTYTIAFQGAGETVTLEFGDVNSMPNSVSVVSGLRQGIKTYFSIRAEIPSPEDEIVWYYDADLNYAQKDVNLNRKFVIGRS